MNELYKCYYNENKICINQDYRSGKVVHCVSPCISCESCIINLLFTLDFYTLYSSGQVSKEDIHQYINKWYTDESIKCELHEYLGMTEKQFNTWVETNEIMIKEEQLYE